MIVHVIEFLDDKHGGPAKSVPYIAHYGRLSGVTSQIWSSEYSGDDENELVRKFMVEWKRFKTIGPKKLVFSFGLLLQLWAHRKHKIEVIHVHNLWNLVPFFVFIFCTIFRIKYVISPRGALMAPSLTTGKLRKCIAWFVFQKTMLNNAACVHVTSEEEKIAVISSGVRSSIALIPNGVDLSDFGNINRSRSRQILGLPLHRRYILFCARLHPIKNLEMLLRAFSRLAKSLPDVDLLVVGPGLDSEYGQRCVKLVGTLKLVDRVIFTGLLLGDAKIAAFGSASLFVLPSQTENFGLAVLEALASGLPVITSDKTPWTQLNTSSAGWCIRLNEDELVDTLRKALTLDTVELSKMRQSAYDLAKLYEWNEIGVRYQHLYQCVSGKLEAQANLSSNY